MADQRLLVAERALADAWMAVDRAMALVRDLEERSAAGPTIPHPRPEMPDPSSSVRSSLPPDFPAPWSHGKPPAEVK